MEAALYISPSNLEVEHRSFRNTDCRRHCWSRSRLIGLRAVALVGLDGLQQVRSTAIVQDEDPLSQAPQRCTAELVSTGPALTNVVRQACAHVMDLKITEQVGSSVAQTRG